MSSNLSVSASEFVIAVSNAIDNNDLDELKRLLSIDSSIIDKKYKGDTSIMKASRQCSDPNIIQLLIEKGANINDKEIRDTIDQTPLIVAAQGGCKEIVEILLQAGANIEHRNDQGETALISAAQEGHKEIVQILLEVGANVNQENADGETALELAIKLRHKKDLVDLLLKYGEAKGIKKIKARKTKTKTRNAKTKTRPRKTKKRMNKKRMNKQRK